MIDLTGRRLVVAHNPISSRAKYVRSGVFDRLDQAGYDYDTIEVRKGSLASNVRRLQGQIKPGDVILSAAGDGSAHAVAHAVLAADQSDVALGFLAYGNFNDLPHALNRRLALSDPVALLEQSDEQLLYPIQVSSDGKPQRSALLYATLGWTARAAGEFDNVVSRRKVVRTGKAGLLRSLWSLVGYYFRERHRTILADFIVDGQLYSGRTDIIAANGSAVARLFKTGRRYGQRSDFLFRTLRVRWLTPNLPFLVAGLLGYMSGRKTQQLTIKFAAPQTVPVQCDGEVFEVVDSKQISIKKATRPLRVLQSR